MRRVLAVSAAALVAGTATVLALAAAERAWGNPASAVLLALAAVWLAQAITLLIRRRPR